jgi:hypothetical protein
MSQGPIQTAFGGHGIPDHNPAKFLNRLAVDRQQVVSRNVVQ